MLNRRRFAKLVAASATTSLLARPAISQAGYPNRVVRMICPFPAGGAVDITARLLSARLSEMWGQQIVIENKPGAGGNIGAEAAAHADPDGYTIFIVSIGHAVNRFLYAKLAYDPVTDFAPVTLMMMQPNIMVVPLTSPAKSCAEFIAFAKANKGKISYASSGNGTSIHLCGELFKKLAGVEMQHVPYRGSAPALIDVIPGRLDVMFDNITSSLPHVREGKLRGLAVTTAQRVKVASEFPPIGDTVPGFDVSSWFSLFVPAKTPPDIINKINTDAVAALAHGPTKEKFEQLGSTIIGSTPAQMAAHLKSEMDKWGPVIKEAGIKVEG
jgi:tripartite-type tricarboxylate transporter receptor subunit TctC